MFRTTLEHLFTPDALREAAYAITSRATGIDRESIRAYREDPALLAALREEILSGRYLPQPIERVELPKENGDTRPIALAAARDKIVQKTLAAALTPYFDPLFSDRSYGYRPGRGTLRAIRRCRHILAQGYRYVWRSDIDDFFETIDHRRLLERLRTHIADGRIVELIRRLLLNGAFRSRLWLEHDAGVHQGDALSPLLSNIYLDAMDRWLEEHRVEFVRFADDFTLFFKNKRSQKDLPPRLETYLSEELGLRLEKAKSYAATVSTEGFTFLGVRFRDDRISIDNDRLQKKISSLYKLAKKPLDLDRYLDEVVAFVEGLQRYYLQLLTPDDPQFVQLETALLDSAARRFAREFAEGRMRYKKDALPFALRLPPLRTLQGTARKRFAADLVDRARSLARGRRAEPAADTRALLGKKRQQYAERFATESVLVVESYGSALGVSKGKITLKHKGKVRKKIPLKACERILVQTRGASLSSELVRRCARRGIPIDFIDDSSPYASLHTPVLSYPRRTLRQLEILRDPSRRLAIARALLTAKLKNQRNYLKYLDKHHREAADEIGGIKLQVARLREAGDVDGMMGIEGAASALYWRALGRIVADKLPFPGRVGRGATDPVNSALNYGYAILYGEVQHALVRAGLALHVSFLHALDDAKPTLVFDFIEPFRAFVVDRAVFTMVNREEPLRTDERGRLTSESRRLVAQNVLERLGSYTSYREETVRLRNVIRDQAYRFARYVDGESDKVRFFIGRY